MTRPVLVTGACGLLGSHVVRLLARAGTAVVAVDLDSLATRAAARSLARAGDVRFVPADITDAVAIADVMQAANPRAVIHLAAVIPPGAYRRPAVAERVNVSGTANVVAALESCADPGRLVLASSTAVYGSRNGAKDLGLCTADTPVRPCDVYGAHKVAAEGIVRASGLSWAILRIGGIIAADLARRTDRDSILMDAIIPSDNRIHTVSVDEAAQAFANAVDAKCLGMTLLIAGDESHMLRQHEFARHMMTMAGLGTRNIERGRRGNPDDDDAWFLTDWMDTTRARAVLGFRAIPMDECIAQFRSELNPLRVFLRPFGLVAPTALSLISPYRRMPGEFADPWGVVAARFGREALAPPTSP
jgi:nucleoside-diphosphate-sugar epimerase